MKVNTSWINSFNNSNLELILLVTEQCNFRCVYCYEDFKLGKIEPDVISGVKAFIKKRISEIKSLNLSFFGGEPLLNKAAVYDLSSWANHICKANQVKFEGGITTNGYSLDRETFGRLIEFNIKHFQITLDGESQAHNKYRPTLNGKPSFEKIYANLTMMVQSSYYFNCIIRLNLSAENFLSVKSFLKNYSSPFALDGRFKFHFNPIFGMPDFQAVADTQIDELKNLGSSLGLNVDSLGEEGVCYAGKADSFVIRADGRVQKCTVALENDINNIGQIFKDGTLKIDQEKFKKWLFTDNQNCPLLALSLEKFAIPYENAGKYVK